MFEIGSVVARFKADVTNFNQGVKTVDQNLKKTADNTKRFGNAFAIGTGIAMAGVLALGSSTIKTGAQFQSFRTSFETMLGSAERAGKLLDQITAFAAKTPFELPQVVEGSKRLLAYNISAEKLIPTFKVLGDIAAGVGTDKLPQLITAFGQVSAKGKLMGQELLQFTEAGVNLGGELQKQFGISRDELEKLVSSGQIGFADVERALKGLTSQGGLFFNAMERQSKTFNGAVSNLKDSFVVMKARIGEVIATALTPYISKLASFLSANSKTIVSLVTAAAAVVTLTAVVVGVIKGFFALRAAALALQVSMLPVIGVLGLIAALAGVTVFKAMQKMQDQIGKASRATAGGIESIGNTAEKALGKSVPKAASDAAKKMEELNRQVQEANRTFKEQMADIISSHKDKVTELEKQIGEEKDDFNEAQEEKSFTFARKQEDMKREHQDRVNDIKAQIEEETKKGAEADQTRLADLRLRLAREDADFARHFARLEEDNKRDTERAKAEHEKKLTDLQARLQSEKDFLAKHNEDVKAVRDVQRLDELDLLKRTHQERLAEFERQKVDIAASGSAAGKAFGAKFDSAVLDQVDNLAVVGAPAFEGVGTQLGKEMGDALKQSFIDSIKEMARGLSTIGNDIKKFFSSDTSFNRIDAFAGWMGEQFKKVGLTPRAMGGPVAANFPYLVGERGPELFIPQMAGSVIPNNRLAGATVNVSMAGANIASETIARDFAEMVGDKIIDIVKSNVRV